MPFPAWGLCTGLVGHVELLLGWLLFLEWPQVRHLQGYMKQLCLHGAPATLGKIPWLWELASVRDPREFLGYQGGGLPWALSVRPPHKGLLGL